jgi:diguanylate cyclase (GGDEF)-like protein/PAS domain S-box-containing protein
MTDQRTSARPLGPPHRADRRSQVRAIIGSLAAADARDIPATVDRALRDLAGVLDAGRAWVGHIEGDTLDVIARTDAYSVGSVLHDNLVGLVDRLPAMRDWLLTDEPLDIDLVRLGRRVPDAAAIVEESGLRRCLVVPGRWAGRVGVIGVDSGRGEAWSSDDVELLRSVTDVLIAALGRHEMGLLHAAQQALTDALISNSNDAVLVLDAATRVTFASPRMDAFGWSPHAVIGKKVKDLLHPEDRRHHRLLMPDVGEHRPPHLHRLVGSDGTVRWAETTSTNLFHVPVINGWMCVVRDVTDWRRTELDLAKAQASQRLMGQVAARFATARAVTADGRSTVDELVAEAIGDVRRFLGADRATVWTDVRGDGVLRIEYELTAVGVAPAMPIRVGIPVAALDAHWPTGSSAVHLASADQGTSLFELVDIPGAPRLAHLAMVRLHISAERHGLLMFTALDGQWTPEPGTDEVLEAVGQIITAALSRAEYEHRLAHQANHDQLTGLPNRVLFADRTAMALRRAARTGDHVGVVFLNIDHFKDVNDMLGHASGDAVLTAVGRRLSSVCRADETLARLSGDEYAVVTTGAAGLEVGAVSERIRQALSAPFSINGYEVSVSASSGVAIVNAHEARVVDAPTMVRRAEIAMHEAKAVGISQARSFDDAMEHRMMDRIVLHQELRSAVLPPTQLEVWFQPLMDLTERRLAGLEALVRWNHPRRGLLLPGTFIEIAEDGGVIGEIGLIVLDLALSQLATWTEEGLVDEHVRVSVNASVHQMRDDMFPKLVLERLHAHGVAAHRLDLEITESTFANLDQICPVLDALHRSGVHLSVDDFGTGYSALHYLRSLPIDALKVDRSFVSRLGDAKDAALVRLILGMARELGLSAVAEGVETEEQDRMLRAFGCPIGQGWLYGRPMSIELANQWLSTLD